MKLIATDLDGTLLQLDQSIHENDLKWIKKAEDEGIKVIVATGRQYNTALKLLNGLNFNPDYMICDNGSSIYSVNDNRKLCSFPLEKHAVKEILEFLEDNKYPYSISSDDCRVELKNNIERLEDEFRRNRKQIPDLDPYHLDSLVDMIKSESNGRYHAENYKEILSLDMNYYNISAISFDPDRIREGMKKAANIKGASVVTSAYNNFELLNEKSSKGEALAFISDYLNISLNDTMAIGDNHNDISMFKKAYHSVAMGNAKDDIKSICRYVTLENPEGGVGYAIENFALK